MINEKFWLAIAFLSFVTLIIKYVGPKIAKALDNKSKQIAQEILAAKELKERAEKLLAKAEKYYQESVTFAQKMVKDAEDESQKFIAESKEMLTAEIGKKTAAALDRIKMEEELTVREIKIKIVSSAIKNLSTNITKEMDDKAHNSVVSKATQNFEKIIH